jgi:hypothetical protein
MSSVIAEHFLCPHHQDRVLGEQPPLHLDVKLADQIGCYRRQSIVLILAPPVVDLYRLAVLVAGFA